MIPLRIILLLFLIVCAVAVSFSKHLLASVAIYMAFSSIMTIVWLILRSPDLAITEAAVGAGLTSLLFFVMLKKTHAIHLDAKRAKSEAAPPSRPNRGADGTD